MTEDNQSKWVGIRPTNPAENIPVTESAPLTDILVAPSAGSPEFLTLSKKRSPSIADMGTIESFTRTYVPLVVAGGDNNLPIYTVPAGKILIMDYMVGYYSTTTPPFIMFYMKKGADYYYFYRAAYAVAMERHIFQSVIPFEAGEILGIWFTTVINGQTKYGQVVGHLLDLY